MIKKILVAFIMLLLVGMVFAQGNSELNGQQGDKDTNGKDDKRPKFENEKNMLESAKEKLKEKMEKFKEQREKLANNVKNYLQSKENLEKFKEQNKERFLKTPEGIDKARNFLEKAIERMQYKLDLLKVHITYNQNYPNAEETLAAIESYKTELENMKTQIPDLNDEAAIKKMAQDIQAKWAEMHSESKKYSAEVASNKIDEVTEKFDALLAKAYEQINKITDENKKANLESKYAEVSEKYARAKTKLAQAKELLQNSIDKTSRDEAYKMLKEGNTLLKEAHKALRELIREILKGQKPIPAQINDTTDSNEISDANE